MNPDVVCMRCGKSDYRQEISGNHIKAVCNSCDAYIKFLPQNAVTEDTEMYFGKYKGVKLKNIPPDYLIWLIDNATKLGGSLKVWLYENKTRLQQKVHEAK